ncbi:putative dehydrogenase [Streptomyces pseudovenezuelae]|uniref:Dehydrogenase n=2 Tax=Streptomyces pseudovenezuelae TaxID=67350 RepID=A0ABT6LEF2_9ACTN|nr:putative dehydrogenase [Streptomyces pseudovenezuelae]
MPRPSPDPVSGRPRLGVAMIGHSFMGAVHSQAWRTAPRVFDLPFDVDMTVVCGRDPKGTARAAERLGWGDWAADWQQVVRRDDVDVVDICTPGDSHADIATAALAAGKHVLCEKPLANTVEEAERMAAAAQVAAEAGVRSMVGFNNRRVPALAHAARLIAEGRIGEVRHVRAQYLQDWIVDPEFPLVWRLRKERAGSGALGDLGSHVIDLLQHLTGERLTGVSATQATFVTERPLPTESSGLSARAGEQRGQVTVDDATAFTGRLEGGALVVVEATRFATGRKNAMRIEVNGSRGSVAFDFESMNELLLYDADDPETEAGFRRILVTEPEHPYLGAWWPPGHGLGYEHAFVHQVHDFLTAVAEDGSEPRPSFADGLQVQYVMRAVERSAADSSRWTSVG